MAEGFIVVPGDTEAMDAGDEVLIQLLQGVDFQEDANI